jgi:uncharacterized membrane protein
MAIGTAMNLESRPFELGKNRIEALSDGVFAIAMTLLVLEIHVPDLSPNASNLELTPALLHLWPKFLAYAVSFVSLGIYWISHHNIYHVIRRADRVLLWLNLCFFMFAAFLPFSTSLLNAFRQTQIAPLVFGANLTLIGWILFLQWTYASSQPGMLTESVTREYCVAIRFRFLTIPIVATLAMLVCFWSAEILLAVYALLLPFYVIPGESRRLAAKARARQREPG